MTKSNTSLNVALVGNPNSQEQRSSGSHSVSTRPGVLNSDHIGIEPLAQLAYSAPLACGEDRRARIRADIRRYSASCGCEVGSLFMIAAMVSFLAYLAFGAAGWSTGSAVWRGVVWVISWAVAGKLLGLIYARIRLHLLLAAQRREFAIPADPIRQPSSPSLCSESIPLSASSAWSISETAPTSIHKGEIHHGRSL